MHNNTDLKTSSNMPSGKSLVWPVWTLEGGGISTTDGDISQKKVHGAEQARQSRFPARITPPPGP